MAIQTVLVVGATGTLGRKIAKALIERGARVRALVRSTSDRSPLQASGVADFAVGDLLDPGSLKSALAIQPKADAIVASAAGYTRHTKGDSRLTDTIGYRNLVDASREAGIPKFVLISILESDKAVSVPHFHDKYQIEEYLRRKGQPFVALRAGAFLDQADDRVLAAVKSGYYPAFFPRVELGMVYTPDLARYASMAALSAPASAAGTIVDVGWASPASGEDLARAFSKVLGRAIVEKPAFPPFIAKIVLPLMGLFLPFAKDMRAMMSWVETGAYVSKNTERQKSLFDDLPTIEEAVRRYCGDRGLL
jgi:uncharacterized protein YbjT (DUF2867 family)